MKIKINRFPVVTNGTPETDTRPPGEKPADVKGGVNVPSIGRRVFVSFNDIPKSATVKVRTNTGKRRGRKSEDLDFLRTAKPGNVFPITIPADKEWSKELGKINTKYAKTLPFKPTIKSDLATRIVYVGYGDPEDKWAVWPNGSRVMRRRMWNGSLTEVPITVGDLAKLAKSDPDSIVREPDAEIPSQALDNPTDNSTNSDDDDFEDED